MGGRGFAAVGRRALLAVLACVLCLCCWRCLRARTRAFLLSYPVYYKRRGVWCPAAFATDGRRGLLALDVFRRPQFFFLRARGRCQRHRRPSHFHNHYLTANPSGSAKVRAWFMRHNKPGVFCVYKTALSFSTGAGLAHPAAMRAPLFYLPRASGAQNLVCLTAHKIFTVVGPALRVFFLYLSRTRDFWGTDFSHPHWFLLSLLHSFSFSGTQPAPVTTSRGVAASTDHEN